MHNYQILQTPQAQDSISKLATVAIKNKTSTSAETMAFSNNSRNIANLLRQDPDDRNGRPNKNLSKQMSSILGGGPADLPVPLPTSSLPNVNYRPGSQDPKQNNPYNNNYPLEQISRSQQQARRVTPSDDYDQQFTLTGSASNLVIQIQALEKQLQTESRKSRKIIQQLQMNRSKFEEQNRYLEDRQNNIENRLMAKLSDMENLLSRERQLKNEVQQKLGSSEMSQREIVQLIKNLQETHSSQLLALKAYVQDKKTEDQALLSKEKQKSTTLFLQVVRLGDNLEKASEAIKTVSSNFENRVQYLESKLSNSEKNLSVLAQKNTSGADVLNEFGEKVMNRLQQVESNLLILGKEQLKDKENLNKLDSSNTRLTEDLNNLLKSMQNDFQNRIEGRVTEIVNRIVYEREERVKAQEQIRKTLDLRERIIAEKQMNQKEQLESRYATMDVQIRNEFMRKDETIKQLQNAIEEQFRAIAREMAENSKQREQTDAITAGELKRIQESFRKEYDMYKMHQNDLVQKITEMMKIEIGARLNSDVDLKNLTSAIATDLVSDITSFKEAFSTTTKKLAASIKEIKTESADRAAQLSHYIDQEIRKVINVVTEKYGKMKNVFAKLTEQFRNHLLTTETNRKNIEARVTSNERDFQILKNQVNSVIDEFHSDLQTRLRQEKEAIETFTFKKQNENTIRLNKLEEYITQHFELLKDGLEGNKELVTARLNSISADKNKSLDSNSQEFKELVQVVHKIKDVTDNLKLDTEMETKQMKVSITDNNTRTKEELNKLSKELALLKSQIESEKNSGSRGADKIQEDVRECYKTLSELQGVVRQGQDKTDEEILKLKTGLTVLQSEVKSQDKALHDDISKLIEITDMLKDAQNK